MTSTTPGPGPGSVRALHRLARLHGVHPVWRGAEGALQVVEPDALLAVLATLGHELRAPEEAPDAARAALAAREGRLVEPVVVAWHAATRPEVELRTGAASRFDARLADWDPETGPGTERGAWSVRTERLEALLPRPGRERAVRWTLPLELEPGWYELELEAGERQGRAVLVVAPRRLRALPRGAGVFAPLQELHDARTRGCGGFGELGRLARWAGACGADHVATLPITAAEPDEASPYAPLSRRYWNERYLDLDRLAEREGCERARRLLQDPTARLAQGAPLADPAGASRLATRVLALCAERVAGARAEALAAFARARPELAHYARWRAERGGLPEGVRADAAALHRYAQWACEEQLEEVARDARARGVGLLLDLPLGVRGDGFDVAAAPEAFLSAASAGAPPDAFFGGGQSWGFPPPHPAGMRERAHRDLALAIRQHARFASALRLDHVMSVRRLWVVPAGADPRAGAYLRYPAEEQLAVLCLEAARADCAVVGEDLGTVPEPVRVAMREHGLHRTLLLPFAFDPGDPDSLERVPERAVVALNSHDLPPFAAFWTGADLDEHAERGELTPQELARERGQRDRFRAAWRAELERRGAPADGRGGADLAREVEPVLAASLAALAGGPARHLSVSLDDLCGETRRQNAPGTLRPENWRLRARHSLEELENDEGIARLLSDVARRGRVADPAGAPRAPGPAPSEPTP